MHEISYNSQLKIYNCNSTHNYNRKTWVDIPSYIIISCSDLGNLINRFEHDSMLTIERFWSSYKKLNEDKYHFLLSGVLLSDVSVVIRRAIEAVSVHLVPNYIKIPCMEEEVSKMVIKFHENHTFPKCIRMWIFQEKDQLLIQQVISLIVKVDIYWSAKLLLIVLIDFFT